MARQQIMRIELTKYSQAKLNELSGLQGEAKVSVMSCLFEFFYAQDDAVKHVMVGTFPAEIEAN